MKRTLSLIALSALASTACNETAEKTPLDPIEHEGYYAVVSNNYSGAIAISLLGEDGEVIEDNWVGSTTENDDLRSPLSEDVVLPSVSESRRYLTTIERGLGVVTRFDLEDGSVIGQLRTDKSDEDDEAAYHSNPQDVAYVSEESAWVSRWAANSDEDADEDEQGSDLIEFDPKTMERTERRVDLSELSAEVEEAQYDEEGMVTGMVTSVAHARPAIIAQASGHLVVSLVRSTDSYSYAEGMVAVVDPQSAELVESFALEGLSNCGDVRNVPGESAHVVILCTGAWGDGGAGAGIVELEIADDGGVEIVHAFKIAEHEAAANTNSSLGVIESGLVVAVAAGELDADGAVMTPDKAYLVDLDSGEQTEIWASEGAYSLGIPAFDAESGMLLLPDAGDTESLYGVQRFSFEDGEMREDDFVEVAPDTTLAARLVLAL